VLSIVAEGFPIPRGRVFELLQLLSAPVIDLDGISEMMHTEPRLQAKILGLLKSSPFREYQRPLGVPEAVVLLGSERLRILTLGCALANFAGSRLTAETMRDFWHHGILTGLLSERIAQEVQPDAAEKAYLGGLLHDIGRLPLLIVAREQELNGTRVPPGVHGDPLLESSYFGVDHCEVGRWIALSGNFAPWMADIIQYHHDPSHVAGDATLAAIVAASDRCCPVPSHPERGDRHAGYPLTRDYGELLLHMRPAGLLEDDRAAQSCFLENSSLYSPFPRFGSC
jgi:putative nucleotidyltransferase with HDIG domain